jgi:hypothetical protein
VKSVGALQTMLAWAEDRALLRSTPSADPGAKTGARAEHTSALRSLDDRTTTAPGLARTRQTFAARCRDIRATMPITTQLRRSDEIPFHGEPRHLREAEPAPVLPASFNGATSSENSSQLSQSRNLLLKSQPVLAD